jgi:hypothetical protein
MRFAPALEAWMANPWRVAVVVVVVVMVVMVAALLLLLLPPLPPPPPLLLLLLLLLGLQKECCRWRRNAEAHKVVVKAWHHLWSRCALPAGRQCSRVTTNTSSTSISISRHPRVVAAAGEAAATTAKAVITTTLTRSRTVAAVGGWWRAPPHSSCARLRCWRSGSPRSPCTPCPAPLAWRCTTESRSPSPRQRQPDPLQRHRREAGRRPSAQRCLRPPLAEGLVLVSLAMTALLAAVVAALVVVVVVVMLKVLMAAAVVVVVVLREPWESQLPKPASNSRRLQDRMCHRPPPPLRTTTAMTTIVSRGVPRSEQCGHALHGCWTLGIWLTAQT